ncbi:hypothetical protein KVR01_008808 [Diaporthe batatas]|uniref:uncharacterized protein n=1 Tax=Diaporthe batatas TaxID=748121 RepID=UPI001D04D50B|nr:uncharacterized protein KVR01_008808 [Diaporthe batatas]KAG8161821.1 hypothetical protein KVR01_008808 [Diaporthe batatas]
MFFPKADAAVLSYKLAPPPSYPEVVGPIYDPRNADSPCPAWSPDEQKALYPPKAEPYAPATIPEKRQCYSDCYLRAPLARNERLRLSMLWYYTRDIFKEFEFLSGLQEKVCIAQESTGWDCAIIGVLDVNFYKRLATVGTPLGILPRGETLCAHMVAQPLGSVFLLPDMRRDWRFEKSPYVEYGGLLAYAGAPLRLQNEDGDAVCLGSICVASTTPREPLTRAQQTTIARLADWIVSDIVQLTRARRQRERRRMVDMLAAAQEETDDAVSEEPITRMLQTAYPGAVISLQTCKAGHVEFKGRDPVSLSEFSSHVWEDAEYIDDFIAQSNHRELPTDRVVRAIAAPCESVSGHSYLVVGSKDFQQIFDDIDAWFVQTCAVIISQMWHKRLLGEVMVAKEKFLRGFSHQLRTPVHGILGSVELLAEDLKARKLGDTVSTTMELLQTNAITKTDVDHGVYLDTIKTAGRDLISIINSMITLNRWADVAITERQYATYTTYELEAELAAEVQKVISGDTRYNASIFFNHNFPPDRCSLRTDLGLLRDSLLPVIVNAIQNTPKGLVEISISVQPESKQLVVDIKDTGHGIPAKDHQRIFELYEQVDVYSTGAGLGLTLATRFAALLQGSIELVSSEINHGSHFRATFQDVELECSESPLRPEPAVTQPANIPLRFHVVPCSKASNLSDHFAKSLTCYGFTASENLEDALAILEFVADPEEHRAMISQLPSDRVVLCPVPFSEGELGFDNTTHTNVVYVHGPFGARTLSSALERADKVISLFDQAVKPRATTDLVVLPKPTACMSNDKTEPEGVPNGESEAAASLMVDPSGTPKSPGCESASVPSSPKPLQVHRTEEGVPVDPLHSRKGQLLQVTPPAEDSPAVPEPQSSADTIAKDGQTLSDQYQKSELADIFADHSTTSNPTALLVDDNALNLQVMQMYCKKRSLPYLCARDGLEAISVFQNRQECAAAEKEVSPIQLVLMDLQMPMCDGIEATKRIRQLEKERNWGQSVLFTVTGQDSLADRAAARDAGSQEYHVKPLSMKTLDTGLKRYFPCFQAGKR